MLVFLIISGVMAIAIAIVKAYYYGKGSIDKKRIEAQLEDTRMLFNEIESLDPYEKILFDAENDFMAYCKELKNSTNDEIDRLSQLQDQDRYMRVIGCLKEKRWEYYELLEKSNYAFNKYKEIIKKLKENSEFKKCKKRLKGYSASSFEIESTQFTEWASLSKFFIIILVLVYSIISTVMGNPNMYLWYASITSLLCMSLFILFYFILYGRNRTWMSSPDFELEQLHRQLNYYKDIKNGAKPVFGIIEYDDLLKCACDTVYGFTSLYDSVRQKQAIVYAIDIVDSISWLVILMLAALGYSLI